MFGAPVLRTEDPRFLRGEGRYLENVEIDGALRAVFVRSIMPHARLSGVEVEAARAMPGVVAVLVAGDLDLPPQPPSGNVEGASGTLEGPFSREILARTRRCATWARRSRSSWRRRCAGPRTRRRWWSPTTSRSPRSSTRRRPPPTARPCSGPSSAATSRTSSSRTGTPRTCWPGPRSWCAGRFVNQRLAPVPMETNGIAVVPGARRERSRCGSPRRCRSTSASDLADALGVEKAAVRTIAPDVGGGFGAKLQVYPGVPGGRARGAGPGSAGPLDGDAQREHGEPHARPRPGAARGDGGEARRHARGDARGAAGRHGRLSDRRVPAHHDAGDAGRRLPVPRDRVSRAAAS